MRTAIRSLPLLLLAAAAFAAAGGAGRPWPGESGQPALAKDGPSAPRATAEADSLHEELGFDGEPGWYWPDFARGEAGRFRRELETPFGGLVEGVRLTTVGAPPLHPDPARLRLLDEGGAVLFDSSGVLLHGGGLRETVLLGAPVAVEAGARITIEVARDSLDAAPWFAADDDCFREGRSWLRHEGGGDADLELERDLNFRLLLSAGPGDQAPPRARPGVPARWGLENRELPLSALARDASGVDSVWAVIDGATPLETALVLAGVDDADSTATRWRGALNTALLRPAPGDSLRGRMLALDGAGNLSETPFAARFEDGYDWTPASGRDELSLWPAWPGVPGMAVALRVPLAEIPGAAGTLTVGARARVRGAGVFSLRLVRDEGGEPAVDQYGDWDALSDTVFVTQDGVCDEDLLATFVLPDTLQALQGSRTWLLLRWESFPDPLAPPSLLAEAADSTAGFDAATAPSYGYDPARGVAALEPLRHATPLLGARLSIVSCEVDLGAGPLREEFEQAQNVSELRCWTRNGEAVPDTVAWGWEASFGRSINTTSFAPDRNGFSWDPRWDPDTLQSGEFVYVRSHAPALAIDDTLFTPTLSYSGTSVVLSLHSYYSDYYVPNDELDAEEEAEILVRQHPDDAALGTWSVLAGEASFAAVSSEDSLRFMVDTMAVVFPAPVWRRWTRQIDGLDPVGHMQLAFAYSANFAFGWALDSIVVATPEGAVLGHWFDGPPKTAELGRVHPNPFNPTTTIPYRVLADGPVRVTVHNLLGQRVATLVDERFQRAGAYAVRWEPLHQASGLYLLRLEAGGTADTRRLLYLK